MERRRLSPLGGRAYALESILEAAFDGEINGEDPDRDSAEVSL
jgi:hypothetical protein